MLQRIKFFEKWFYHGQHIVCFKLQHLRFNQLFTYFKSIRSKLMFFQYSHYQLVDVEVIFFFLQFLIFSVNAFAHILSYSSNGMACIIFIHFINITFFVHIIQQISRKPEPTTKNTHRKCRNSLLIDHLICMRIN